MADYFIDFSASSNGDGSSSSPWNQFTSSENSSVNAGDKLWFRRVDPGDNNKYIAWKAGTSSTNRIYYIGWPKENDAFYTSRPSSMRSAWDPDSETYTIQSTNSGSTILANLTSYIEIHRFKFSHNYTNYNASAPAVKIDGKNNINIYTSILRCYTSSTNANAAVCFINNSSNIVFNDCYLKQDNNATSTSYLYSENFKINSSTVTFNDTEFSWDTVDHINDTRKMYVYVSTSTSCTYIKDSTCVFKGGSFKLYCSTTTINATTYTAVTNILNNATVTMSGTNVYFYNEAASTAATYNTNTAPLFNVENASFKYIQSSVNWPNSTTGGSASFLRSRGASDLYINSVEITNLKHTCASFLSIYDNFNTLSLTSISGSITLPASNKLDKSPYFLGLKNYNYVENNATISGVNIQGSAIIYDMSRDTDSISKTLVVDNTSNIFKNIKNIALITSNTDNLIFKKVSFDTVVLMISTYNNYNFLIGQSNGHTKNYVFESCTTNCSTNALLNIFSNNNNVAYCRHSLDIKVIGCSGNSYIIQNNIGTYDFKPTNFKLYSKYNTNFTNNINEAPDKYELTTLNDDYASDTLITETEGYYLKTSLVAREGGAGFSNYVKVKTGILKYQFKFPAQGEDTLWVNIPNPGTYTITAYLLHVGSNTLANNDVVLIAEKYETTYQPVSSTSLLTDSSTWKPSLTNSTPYKLTANITVSYGQFIPIYFYINNTNTDNSFYFDPQLTVV